MATPCEFLSWKKRWMIALRAIILDISIEANDAYGHYDENLVQRVPKDFFISVDELKVSMRFLVEKAQGQVPVEITEIDGDHVVVDANPMLAGQNLNFYVEVIAIREATAEELAHGHVHGAYGHESRP